MVPADDGGFDPKFLETGIYSCKPQLINAVGGIHRCIPNNSCTQVLCSGTCITDPWCRYNRYMYQKTHNGIASTRLRPRATSTVIW